MILPNKTLYRALLLSVVLFFQFSARSQVTNKAFDQALADSLGADSYGMKRYVLVLLKTGSNKSESKAVTDSLFKGHMQTIGRLAKAGKLIVAGPLQKNEKEYRGIYILNVNSLEEATTLLNTDPAINAKVLDTELFTWYGSAALPLYLPYHEKVEKIKM